MQKIESGLLHNLYWNEENCIAIQLLVLDCIAGNSGLGIVL